jgi:hypothetical protein
MRPEQVVAGQAVGAAEDPDAAAERQAGDPDRGTTAGRDGATVLGQRVVEGSQPHPGADGCHLAGDRHRAHGGGVDDVPLVEDRPATECPPLRMAVCSWVRLANPMVTATSAGVLHSTTAAGRRYPKRAITGLRTES